jgi:type II secretory ATPase GspE/PulE/Tfp pilus assembly ATPase PilB-like protein
MRLDPDVILVGEIRDQETAHTAIQAALTGHLVLTTVHANDSAGAIVRLIDLGVERFLVTSAVVGSIAQRLVRKVCEGCAERSAPSEAELMQVGMGEETAGLIDWGGARRGRGCGQCRGTGYRGRVCLVEVLTPSSEIRGLIAGRATAGAIKERALREGMRTLREDGVAKVAAGMWTVDEVVRVTARATE